MGYRKRHSATGGLNRARRRPLSEVRMSTTRIIKKYPNRRLYDTEESRYITLADVRSLVLDGVNFAVIDKKTGANITRCVLLQVICEQEQNGEAILTEGFLSQVVRVYGNADAMKMADHLEDSLNRFLAHQNNVSRDPAQVHYRPETPKTP
jgi:polyhydroxyalkanoate synthesis repressor PhaR